MTARKFRTDLVLAAPQIVSSCQVFTQRWLIVACVTAIWTLPLTAQGLNEPGKRLDETLGQGGQPSSGGQGYPGQGGQGTNAEEYMDMEGGYDSAYDYGDSSGYGGSSGRGAASGTARADAMQTYGSGLISLFGGLDLAPLLAPMTDVTVESGPQLAREAEQAFAAGNQGLANELMFGHMVSEYDEALVALRSVKYSALLRKPVWNIRWGISMAVRSDGATEPSPIREGATPSRRIARGGQSGAESYGSEQGMESSREMEMQQQMEMQREMEMQQQMEQSMEMSMDSEYGGQPGRQPPGSRRATAPKMPVRKMLSEEADATLTKNIGLVAKVFAEAFNQRFSQGDFGPIMTAVAPPAPVEPAPGAARGLPAAPSAPSMSVALNDLLSEAPEPLPMWQPGIVYLGAGNADEVTPVALAHGIDLLLHIDVSLKTARNESVQNVCRCRLIHIATGKSLGISKSMDNWEAAQMAATGRADERTYVQDSLSNLLGIIDRQAKVTDLPTLTPEVAKRRIAALIASPEARTLRTLAEIRLYQAQELITEADVEAAFDIIAGPDALMLLHGPREEQLAMAHEWAVATQAKSER